MKSAPGKALEFNKCSGLACLSGKRLSQAVLTDQLSSLKCNRVLGVYGINSKDKT